MAEKSRLFLNLRVLPLLLIGFVLSVHPAAAFVSENSPESKLPTIYLYWMDDPTSTMRVNWIDHDGSFDFGLEYRRVGGSTWHRASVNSRTVPHTDTKIRTARIHGLRSGASYRFRFQDGKQEWKFRTMPGDLSAPVNFVTGGDLYHHHSYMRPISRQAAQTSPMFAAIGGDWAYADGDPAKVNRWFDMMGYWYEDMVTPEGYLIPFVAAIGNHEVTTGFGGRIEDSPFYLTFFQHRNDRTYYALDFSDYLSMMILDSGHIQPVRGEQSAWLRKELIRRLNVPHVFPMYHVPAWPSFRDANHPRSIAVRENWVPLFETYGVELAFENHDHTFKRTVPIRDGEYSEDGVTYIGDGSWGVQTRTPVPASERWFIYKSTDDFHFWQITLYENERIVQAINERGFLLDYFEQEIRQTTLYSGEDFDTPHQIRLGQNYPNPFNPVTIIPFEIGGNDPVHVNIELFTNSGRRVGTLVDGEYFPGSHFVPLDTRRFNLASGTYLYRINAAGYTRVKKMMLIR